MTRYLSVHGAKTHNLKNISITLEHDKLIVITGLSGSGKSTLAFDTLYAEGQRRYVESLSSYARQFLNVMDKPDVDSIEGLRPSIAIEQKTTSKNPRSTVGTITEIYDYLRLLFARIGIPYSPATGLPIESQTIPQMFERIKTIKEGTKCLMLAPIVQMKKGEYAKELMLLRQKGFQRIKIDNEIYDIDNIPALNRKIAHNISVIIDRFELPSEISKDFEQRIVASIETALPLSNGIIFIDNAIDNSNILILSSRFSCPVSNFSIQEIEPRIFSFNSPKGACERCNGLGTSIEFNKDLIIPDITQSIAQGGIEPLKFIATLNRIQPIKAYKEFAKKIDVSDIERIENFSEIKQKEILNLAIAQLKNIKLNENDPVIDSFVRSYQSEQLCSACDGYRLKKESLCIKVNNKNIIELCSLSIREVHKWFENITLSAYQKQIAELVLQEIKNRLEFLIRVGLDYLTLSRIAGTLSGGETQRIRLASQIGSGLTGVLYVLDEPSIGLHQRDNDRLLETLKRLKNFGNTVIVVEHDEDAMRVSDYIVDMGPGAGALGGEIIAQGKFNEIIKNPNSITGQYLSGKLKISVPQNRRTIKKDSFIEVINANVNNLKNINVKFYLGAMTCVTGVSGSGKSSLVMETLFDKLCGAINVGRKAEINIIGGKIDKVIDIDQSPIGRTPRSNPATYIGCFTQIRDLYATLPESKARGYSPGRFSFNVRGGRCEACQGDGIVCIEMHFLPDVYVKCEQCLGRRYNKETLDILYNGKCIADVLEMTVDEAVDLFHNQKSIYEKLMCLKSVGLGYIHVGQQATTLSGGEAQRIKLAKELSKRSTGNTFYILDEPTTGLHFEDIKKLLEVLHYLTDQGNTIVIIEHNLDVIKTADWIIDIGPEGGDLGGEVIFTGIPEDIAKCTKSHTGKYLKKLLK